jgi:hypothetical protein
LAQSFDELTLSGAAPRLRNIVGRVTQGSQCLALGLALAAASQLVEGSFKSCGFHLSRRIFLDLGASVLSLFPGHFHPEALRLHSGTEKKLRL